MVGYQGGKYFLQQLLPKFLQKKNDFDGNLSPLKVELLLRLMSTFVNSN